MKDKTQQLNAKGKKKKFYVSKDSAFVHIATFLMVMAAIFRIIGCWGLWNDSTYAIAQILLPVAACLLFALCLGLWGDKALWLTSIPAVLLLVFFFFLALGLDNVIFTIALIIGAIAVMLVYIVTVFGVIPTKWIIVALFVLPFIYRIGIVDVKALRDTVNVVSFFDGVQEMSMLSMLLAFACTSLAMKKDKPIENMDLPKIKDPIVISKKKDDAEPAGDEGAKETQTPSQTDPLPAAEESRENKGEDSPQSEKK